MATKTRFDKLLLNLDFQGDCWVRTTCIASNGYSELWEGRKKRHLAHRVSYTEFVGDIPEGLVIDHTCGNRACINPSHLEAVTQRENVMRSPITKAFINSSKTQCKSGHILDAENTYVRKDRVTRDCKTCRKAAVQRWAKA